MDSDNIYNKILEMFGKIPENFSILEEQVDIQTQMSYFEASRKLKENPSLKKDLIEPKEKLFDSEVSTDQKMDYLIQLANSDDVEAFRLLEKYCENPEQELKDWAILALQESRMTLESSLLDENQIIISTGLGGKGKKLRYFAVIAAKENIHFTALQTKLLAKELDFTIKKQEGEIEKIEFDGAYCTMLAIVPLNISIKDLIASSIEECNQIGDFINPKFILTNVKVFSKEEIESSWKDL